MISFASDYIAGAHPAILKRLAETNRESLTGYGTDIYCESAKEKIKAACECPEAEVYFLVGGTQCKSLPGRMQLPRKIPFRCHTGLLCGAWQRGAAKKRAAYGCGKHLKPNFGTDGRTA